MEDVPIVSLFWGRLAGRTGTFNAAGYSSWFGSSVQFYSTTRAIRGYINIRGLDARSA